MSTNEKGEIKIERSSMPSAQPRKVLVKKQSNVEKIEKQQESQINNQEVLDDRLKLKQQQYEEAKARILQNQTLQRNQQKLNSEPPSLLK